MGNLFVLNFYIELTTSNSETSHNPLVLTNNLF
jgi:hypothetical protein